MLLSIRHGTAALALLLTAAPGLCQTVLEGPVQGTLTAEGPVRLRSARVPAGAVLTVPAGTVLDVRAGSRLTVEGTLVLGTDGAAPVVIRGAADGPVVAVAPGGRARLAGVHADAVEAPSLVAVSGDGELTLEDVRVVGGRFGRAVFEAPGAAVSAERLLWADLTAGGPLVRARAVWLAFGTVAGVRGVPSVPLFDAPDVEVSTSVIWPGSPYVGAPPDARVRLEESTVEGDWGRFLGRPSLPDSSESSVYLVTADAPTFTADGSYRLATGTPGADRIPRRRAADADGSPADLGAYGGGYRRLTRSIEVGVQTAVSGYTDRYLLQGDPPERGGGAAVAVRQELSAGWTARLQGGVYRTDLPSGYTLRGFGPDDFLMFTGGLAVLYDVRIGPRLSIGLGPQVVLGRWRHEYGPEATAYQTSLDYSVVDNAGVVWRADLRAEAAVRGPLGVHLRAGIDLPAIPAGKWGTRVEVTQRGAVDEFDVAFAVPLPRVFAGISMAVP